MPISTEPPILQQITLTTPRGDMLAIASENGLCLLEFTTRHTLNRQLAITRTNFNSIIITKTVRANRNPILSRIQFEINDYFVGNLQRFQTPLDLRGTSYQLKIWHRLSQIPYGQTITYTQLANSITSPDSPPDSPPNPAPDPAPDPATATTPPASSARAAGRANGSNRLAIIIPCHRVIRRDGQLAGYAGGLEHKHFLINHEAKYVKSPALER